MIKKVRVPNKRVNFHDGQVVTERDLDAEQAYHRASVSAIAVDFHGSGIIEDSPFSNLILLDTRNPGSYAVDGINLSDSLFAAGSYDGKGIYLDRNVSDQINGTRVEILLSSSTSAGRRSSKVMVIGYKYDSANLNGILDYEIITLTDGVPSVSKNYFTNIVSVIFNHFSGGIGQTVNSTLEVSADNIGTSGWIEIKEVKALSVFVDTDMISQSLSPNIDFNNFISSDINISLSTDISNSLSPSDNFSDLYIDTIGLPSEVFVKNGISSVAFGQKFIAKSDNIQRIDVGLSVALDATRPVGLEFDFTGDLVLSVYELSSNFKAFTDVVPSNLIDLDPGNAPIAEISVNQISLLRDGVKLGANPTVISFDFSNSQISDPASVYGIKPGVYYAFMISRRGDNSVGDVKISKGYTDKAGKTAISTPLSVLEIYQIQEHKFFSFDPNTNRYLTESDHSLWFSVRSDTVEVTSGSAYSADGFQIVLPKVVPFLGNSYVSNYIKGLSIKKRFNGDVNYVVISQANKFSGYVSNAMTRNSVASRIEDELVISILSETEFLALPGAPLAIATIVDKNNRDPQIITGSLFKPGMIAPNKILIENPGAQLLDPSIIGRVITPDITSTNSYKVIAATCSIQVIGDLNNNGLIDTLDVSAMLALTGNSINSDATARSIFGGEFSLYDFIKSDADGDGVIDGIDVKLIEDASNGFFNFPIPAEVTYLELTLENLFSSSDNPIIYSDTTLSGSTASLSSDIILTVSDAAALTIRPGDTIDILAGNDAGNYVVLSKIIEANGTTITLGVTDSAGNAVTFVGSTLFDSIITSATNVNVYADNPGLLLVPFTPSTYEITQNSYKFNGNLIYVCDSKRLVETSFAESGALSTCICTTPTCQQTPVCSVLFKNQKALPGDLYIPNGNILSAPGQMHHGDFEYTNITVPIPPGSISNCTIDLYSTFVKSVGSTCKTAAGFDAMKFSDGTFVGCEDSGINNDIAKNRVKFSSAISSAFLFEQTGGATASGNQAFSSNVIETINHNSRRVFTSNFTGWIANPSNDPAIVPTGSTSDVSFALTTAALAGVRTSSMDAPSPTVPFIGDFTYDFIGNRTVWVDSSITIGSVSAYTVITINNLDNTSSTLKLGWVLTAGGATRLFFSGVTVDANSIQIGSFNYEIPAPTGRLIFRIRRVDNIITAYYQEELTLGNMIRLGANPVLPPGAGTVISASFEAMQSGTPTANVLFNVGFGFLDINSEIVSTDAQVPMVLSNDLATGLSDNIVYTFPLSVTSNFTILSAVIKLTSLTNTPNAGTIDVITFKSQNATNIGVVGNIYPSSNFVFTMPPVLIGDVISVDIAPALTSYLGSTSHLPGQIKAFRIDPDRTITSSVTFDPIVTMDFTILDSLTGISFKIGISIDQATGIATLNTKNVLFDELTKENRTVVNFGVHLKKAGFANKDISINVSDLAKIGIGTCADSAGPQVGDVCYFVVGATGTGTFVQGPLPCSFVTPLV